MPDMVVEKGVVRHLEIEGFQLDIVPDDRFVLVVGYCDESGSPKQVGFARRGQMIAAYAKELARIVTMEECGDVEHPCHVTKVIALTFKDDQTGTFEFLPIMFPQPDQDPVDCSAKHTVQF